MNCELCNSHFDTYDALRRHSSRTHSISSEQCYIRYKLNGVRPVCKCGCGNSVTFRRGEFSEYLVGHLAKHKNPMQGKSHTDDIRKKMKVSQQDRRKDYYETKTCPRCNVEFRALKSWEKKYCSYKCVANDPELNEQKKNAREHTNTKRYGKAYPLSVDEKVDLARETKWNNTYDKLSLKWSPLVEFLFSKNEYKGRISGPYKFRCRSCDSVFTDRFISAKIERPRCPTCYPTMNFTSHIEQEILAYITEIYTGPISTNDRTILDGRELDIYLPELNVAIEVNGVYWHSELRGKDKSYHLDKTLLCNQKGIRLLHIMDLEWISSKEIVKNILNGILDIPRRIVYARQTTLRDVSPEDAQVFFDANHIQGQRGAKICYGLYRGDQLVMAMSFGRSRYTSNHEWEIIRQATTTHTTVVGGTSKLFAHFVKIHSPQSVVTYADRRYFTGDSYKKVGFLFDGTSSPGYHYLPPTYDILLNRLQYQKHKLSQILETFDPALSEWENMQINGYDRIWDCGQYRYTWKTN